MRPTFDERIAEEQLAELEGRTVRMQELQKVPGPDLVRRREQQTVRSEEHTSELQSLMRISYAVFSLKNKIHKYRHNNNTSYKQPAVSRISIGIQDLKEPI